MRYQGSSQDRRNRKLDNDAGALSMIGAYRGKIDEKPFNLPESEKP